MFCVFLFCFCFSSVFLKINEVFWEHVKSSLRELAVNFTEEENLKVGRGRGRKERESSELLDVIRP